MSVIVNPGGSGASSAGSVINSASSSYATNTALSAAIPLDDTIPQKTEGTEIITATITPSSASNILRCRFNAQVTNDTVGTAASAALFQDTTTNAFAATWVGTGVVNVPSNLVLTSEITAGTTSATTIKLRVGPNANNLYINGTAGARLFGGVSAAWLVVEEIKV